MEEEPLEEVEEWAETQFHNSGVLGKPTLSIYIPPSKPSKHARSLDDGEPTLALHLLPDVLKRIILLHFISKSS